MAKQRFILAAPYLALTVALFCRAYFAPDYSSPILGAADLLLLLLTFPWNGLLLVVMRLSGSESSLMLSAGMAGAVALNAAILYYIGLKFERAPDRPA